MPALMINIVNGRWVAEVANTDVSYAFLGGSLEMQAQYVQNLSLAMELNQTENLVSFFNAPGVGSDTLAGQLFEGTDTIIYAGRAVYASVGDDYLIDELAEAGEALAAAL